MPFHRTLIATAVTACMIAGALTFAGLARTEPSSLPEAAGALLTAPDRDTTASPSAAPAVAFGTRTRPAVAPPDAVPIVAVPTVAVPTVVHPVGIPAAAEPLEVALAPAAASALIATGIEAAAWLDDAPGSVTAAVADNLDTTPDELREQFVDDPSAFLSTDGMAGYIESIPDDELTDASADAPTDAPLVDGNGQTPIDVFALHSLPSSTKVVYLDFDGHQMENEFWQAFEGLDRDALVQRTLQVLADRGQPMTLAQLAAALPPGQHDLETLALWLAMAREAGVELQPGEEPIDTQDGGRHWRFTVSRVTLDGAHLAHMDWEL